MTALDTRFWDERTLQPKLNVLDDMTLTDTETLCEVLQERPDLTESIEYLFTLANEYYANEGNRDAVHAIIQERHAVLQADWNTIAQCRDPQKRVLFDIYLKAVSTYAKRRVVDLFNQEKRWK